jgi:hypothetical protein
MALRLHSFRAASIRPLQKKHPSRLLLPLPCQAHLHRLLLGRQALDLVVSLDLTLILRRLAGVPAGGRGRG